MSSNFSTAPKASAQALNAAGAEKAILPRGSQNA
jgi:hypothetical protein